MGYVEVVFQILIGVIISIFVFIGANVAREVGFGKVFAKIVFIIEIFVAKLGIKIKKLSNRDGKKSSCLHHHSLHLSSVCQDHRWNTIATPLIKRF